MKYDITDVLVMESLDEVSDTFVLRDTGDSMCVERRLVENVFVSSAKQQYSSTLQLHAYTHIV